MKTGSLHSTPRFACHRSCRFVATVIAAVLTGAVPLAIHAQDIISLKVTTPKNSNQNWMYAGDYAGAPGVRTNNWNNMLAAADGSKADITLAAGTIIDAGGTLVPDMQAVWHTTQNGSSAFYNRTAGGTNDGKMFADVDDVYNANSFSSYGYLDLTNVPFTNYNIYCYFRPDNGSGASATRGGFWLITNAPAGAARVYCKNQSNDVAFTQIAIPSSDGSGYVQSFTTSIGPGNTGVPFTAMDGGNYGVLTGLTNSSVRIWFGALGNGSGALDDLGNYVTDGNGAVRFKLCGFQICQNSSSPPIGIYLQNTNLTMHAGDPAGTQVTVLADLANGSHGVNVTAQCTFSVDNTSVATVTSGGLLHAGADGTANLLVTLPSAGLSLTNPVPVLGPTSLSLSLAKTNLLVGNGQGDVTTATLYANFSDAINVNLGSFNYVSFSSSPGGLVTVTPDGVITAVGAGTFSITGLYDGLSVTATNVGTVTAYTAPTGTPSFGVNLTDASHSMAFHDLAGGFAERFAYWNNMVQSTGNVTNTLNEPVDSQGDPLTTTVVQVMPGSHDWQRISTAGTPSVNESTLFDTFFDIGMNNGTTVPSTLVVSNVPWSKYDVYFYIYNDNSSGGTNRPGEVTINGVTQYRINNPSAPSQPDNNGNGYVLAAPQPASTPYFNAAIPWGNVIKFSGLTDPTLTATWAGLGQDYIADAATVTRMRLVGFQIVKSLDGIQMTNMYVWPPVPDQLPGNPAAFSLTVLGDGSDGTKGGNITGLTGMTYSSSDTNVFMVDTNGVITAGLTPGTATLTISYQTLIVNTTVTNLAPTSITPVAAPDTVYTGSVLGLLNSQAHLLADFPGQPNVDVSSFFGVSYTGDNPSVASVSSSGAITPTGTTGVVGLGATYAGASGLNPNGFTVTTNGATFLKHRYTFEDAPGSSTVQDSVGTADGTVFSALDGFQPITLDGEYANFPGDSTYTTAPYIALPAGLLNSLNDVTFDFWFTVRTNAPWARIFDFGDSTKGTDPHNSGSFVASSMMFSPFPGGSPAYPRFEIRMPSGNVYVAATNGLATGVEHHVTLVYSPNQGIIKMYLDGVFNTNMPTAAGATMNTFVDTHSWLGVSGNNDATLNGSIDQLDIYEGAFSDAKVAETEAAGPVRGELTTPPNLDISVSAGNLTISWPPGYLVWTLETNSVGLTATGAWSAYPGSTTVTNVTVAIGASGNVFYRLKR